MQYLTAHRLAADFHATCKDLEIDTEIKNKVVAASANIPFHLSSASRRRTPREQVHYFHTALASFNECRSLIDLCGYRNEEFLRKSDILSTWLHRLVSGAMAGRNMAS